MHLAVLRRPCACYLCRCTFNIAPSLLSNLLPWRPSCHDDCQLLHTSACNHSPGFIAALRCNHLQAINNFCREIGVTRSEGEVHLHKLDHHIRAGGPLSALEPRAVWNVVLRSICWVALGPCCPRKSFASPASAEPDMAAWLSM